MFTRLERKCARAPSSRPVPEVSAELEANPASAKTSDKLEMSSPRLRSPPLAAGLLLVLVVVRAASGFFIDERQSPSSHSWTYGDQSQWPAEFKQCNKQAQSPIDIRHRNVISNVQLKLRFYNFDRLTRFKIQNAHHTIKLNPIEAAEAADRFGLKLAPVGGGDDAFNGSDFSTLSEDVVVSGGSEPAAKLRRPEGADRLGAGRSHQHGRPQLEQAAGSNSLDEPAGGQSPASAYDGAPTIKLDWLDDGNNEYKLRDIHFHWAERRDNGSEHAIDGRRAAMEMHLVHIKHGLDRSKIGFTSDSVAVIAVLIESYRKSNADFNPIVNKLSAINGTEQPQEIEYKTINDLLPSTLHSFYTYSGSLTTPPCYQVVNWIVMQNRLYMNAKQIEMFRNLHAPPSSHDADDSADHVEPRAPIMPNVRQLQPLNNRTILASFQTMSRLDSIHVNYDTSGGGSSAGRLAEWLVALSALAGASWTLADGRLLAATRG